jgi:electron transfer flavoprotein beta subunit
MKGILAAKKKPVESWTLADLAIDTTSVGMDAAWSKVLQTTPRPPKEPGRVIAEGDAVPALIDFLAAGKYI